MTMPLASVLSITYNHAPYISQAIESFLAQETTFPFEIVIGEDCSADGTRDIVFDYAGRHPDLIRVITADRNVGGPANFLRAVKECRGRYIATCEGDDYWQHPGKLQMQVDFLEANPDYGAVHSDLELITKRNLRLPTYFPPGYLGSFGDHPTPKDILTSRYWCHMATLCCRRTLLESVIRDDPLGFSGYRIVGDRQLLAGLVSKAPIKYMDVALATYRKNNGSVTGAQDYESRLRLWSEMQKVTNHLIRKYSIDQETAGFLNDELFHGRVALAHMARDTKTVLELVGQRRLDAKAIGTVDRLYYWCARFSLLDRIVRPLLATRRRLITWRRGY